MCSLQDASEETPCVRFDPLSVWMGVAGPLELKADRKRQGLQDSKVSCYGPNS